MSIAQEVFSRVKNVQSCRSQYASEVIKNMTDVWSEFIFKDIKKARKLKNKGYKFILLGQDIYDRGVDSDLPTGHYSYLLLITYKERSINPLDHIETLGKVLYDELLNDYIYLSDNSIIYSSITRENISANIFISTHERNEHNDSLFVSSIVGDSLVYLCVSVPYLVFDIDHPIRFSKYDLTYSSMIDDTNSMIIRFETHINGLMPDTVNCAFTMQ
jgi:hypothetical protein